jgi:hypothetical protein
VQKINLRNNVRLRWMFGVPMLLLGALCIDFGHEQEITTIVWGAWLAVIAVVLLAERRFLAVDTQSGLLSSKRGILYPFTWASFAIADVKHIELMPYTPRSHSQSDGPRRVRRQRRALVHTPVLRDRGSVLRSGASCVFRTLAPDIHKPERVVPTGLVAVLEQSEIWGDRGIDPGDGWH